MVADLSENICRIHLISRYFKKSSLKSFEEGWVTLKINHESVNCASFKMNIFKHVINTPCRFELARTLL